MKKLVIAAAVLMAATPAALVPAMAQGYVFAQPSYGYGTYDYAPGYGVYDSAPAYGGYAYAPSTPSFGNNWYDLDRVDGPGRGNSAESQR